MEAYPINPGFATLPADRCPGGATDWLDSVHPKTPVSPQRRKVRREIVNENN
jgi:hypothetical protein